MIHQQPDSAPVLSLAGSLPAAGLSLRANLLSQFEQGIRETYPQGSTHPYHNWQHHIPQVMKATALLIERIERAGGQVDRDVVAAAVLGHDAGYGYDFRTLGFKSREDLAADLSERLLLQLGSDPLFAGRVAGAIRATERGAPMVSIEEHLLRAADLNGLAGEQKDFLADSHRLHIEYQRARGERSEYLTFFRWQTDVVLSGYLAAMIQLTPEAGDALGRSLWHQRAVANICSTDWQASTIALIGCDSLPAAVMAGREMSGSELILATADRTRLTHELERLQKLEGRNGVPVLVVPGRSGAVSLPDRSCTEVHVQLDRSLVDIYEAIRVAQDGASLSIYLPQTMSGLNNLVIEGVLEIGGIKGLSRIQVHADCIELSFDVAHTGDR